MAKNLFEVQQYTGILTVESHQTFERVLFMFIVFLHLL